MSLLHDVPHDAARVPAGARLRRLTTAISGTREGRRLGALLMEVWYLALAAAVVVAMLATTSQAVRDVVRSGADAAPSSLDGDLAVVLVLVAAVGALLGLSARLGPVAVGGGAATWWLPLPVDRRGLLRPTALRGPLLGAAAGLVVGVAAPLALVEGVDVAAVLRWAGTGAAAGGLAAALAGVGQLRGVGRRRLASAGDAVLATAAVLAALIALEVPGPWAAAGRGDRLALTPPWVVVVLVAVVGVLAALAVERSSDRILGESLRTTGSLAGRGQAAVLSMDVREMGRVLDLGRGRATYRSRRLLPGGPRRAVVVADLVVLTRTPRLLVQLGVAALVGLAAARMPLTGSGLPLWLALGVIGFWGVNAVAVGARHADLVPALDRSLPLSARVVRAVRGVVPLLAGVLWSAVVLGAQAVRADDAAWLLVVPAWAVVLAAGALRSSFRPVPKFRTVAISSPMGGVPQPGTSLHGVDLVLLMTLPTGLAAHQGGFTSTTLLAQSGLAVLAAWWVVRAARGDDEPRRAKQA